MTSRHDRWARLRRQLWQPPRAHGEQPRERVVGPLELFYDLVVVALAVMGASMVGLVEHAHDSRTPAATAWALCGGAAVVLCVTILLATTLRVWRPDRGLYRPPARTCVVAAVVCAGVAAARPAPLVLGLALVVLFGVPWGLAVAYRLSHGEVSATL